MNEHGVADVLACDDPRIVPKHPDVLFPRTHVATAFLIVLLTPLSVRRAANTPFVYSFV